MTNKHVYEQPKITVYQLEESYGLLATSDKTVTLDKETYPDVNWKPKEENPEGGIDAKKNTWGTTLWNE